MTELSELLNLQQKYGVVKFRGTVHFNTTHESAFQSDNAPEAMHELEKLCAGSDGVHGYMLTLK